MPQREQWKISLPPDLARVADTSRGQLSRSQYVEQLIRQNPIVGPRILGDDEAKDLLERGERFIEETEREPSRLQTTDALHDDIEEIIPAPVSSSSENRVDANGNAYYLRGEGEDEQTGKPVVLLGRVGTNEEYEVDRSVWDALEPQESTSEED